jgi:hypothetical protein
VMGLSLYKPALIIDLRSSYFAFVIKGALRGRCI